MGFGLVWLSAIAGTVRKDVFVFMSGCFGSMLAPNTPRHGVDGTDLQWAKPKGASGDVPAATPGCRNGLADGSRP
jgi:hypothetical protein